MKRRMSRGPIGAEHGVFGRNAGVSRHFKPSLFQITNSLSGLFRPDGTVVHTLFLPAHPNLPAAVWRARGAALRAGWSPRCRRGPCARSPRCCLQGHAAGADCPTPRAPGTLAPGLTLTGLCFSALAPHSCGCPVPPGRRPPRDPGHNSSASARTCASDRKHMAAAAPPRLLGNLRPPPPRRPSTWREQTTRKQLPRTSA